MAMTMEKAQVTLPSDREVKVTRSLKAARQLVYRAYTEPALVQRWLLGPPGWSMPVCEMDVRVGGRYRWRWRSDEDASEFGFAGTFREVQPLSRLVHTESVRSWDSRRRTPPERSARVGDIHGGWRHHDGDHADRLRIEGGPRRSGGNRHDRRHGAELSAARGAAQRARVAAAIIVEHLNEDPSECLRSERIQERSAGGRRLSRDAARGRA